MSTEWGYKCLTCNQESEDTWFNHGQDKLVEAVQVWPEIKKIQATVWLRVVFDSDRYLSEPFLFLAQHEGHEIVLLNEYGKTEAIPPD